MKKFIKKIGKGIKKVGKAIGKPFKKLMKTKIGKIIGTIGMMMMGGWMLAGAKTFIGSMFTTGSVGTAFTNTMASMGAELGTAYSSVTGAVKGMFTGGGTGSVAAGSEAAAARVMTAADAAAAAGTTTPTIVGGETILAQAEAKAAAEAAAANIAAGPQAGEIIGNKIADLPSPTNTSKVVIDSTGTGTTPSGRVIEGAAETTKTIDKNLPEFVEGTSTDDFFDPDIKGQKTVRAGRNLEDRIVRKATGTENLLDKVKNVLYDSENITEAWDSTLGFKPFKNMPNAPKFVQGTNLAELKTGYTLLQKPEEQYQQGASDMSGAYAALDANSQRLYTGNTPSMATLMDGRTSIPSPSVVGTAAYTRLAKDASFLYDSTLIAS